MQVQIPAEERNWAMASHLSALVAIAGLPFGHVLGPLVVYLIKGHESEFVGEHARASLNYQITVSIFFIVAVIVALGIMFGILIPMSALPSDSASTTAGVSLVVFWLAFGLGVLLVLLASLIFIVMGTVAASEGRPYAYPLAIRFLR
ncbi:MAG: DUF4870 domain-containing protein [Candidatus Cybelea sp.]